MTVTPLDILLLKGGPSAEREVSLVTGAACTQALRSLGHRVTAYELTRDLGALCKALTPKPDVVFNSLHGHYGEDGCIQGILDLLEVRYTHSGVLASAMAMDKPLAKRLFTSAGMLVPEGQIAGLEDFRDGDPMPRPYVVKPLAEGSSVGVTIVREHDNPPPMTTETWNYGEEALLERYIGGRELTVSVLGNRPLTVTELRPKVGFYDYEAKYTEGKTEHLIPAAVHPQIFQKALNWALKAHRLLGCNGVTRADYRYDDADGEPGDLYLLEINTQPGMTPLSLVPEQARHLGMSFPALCQWIVEEALSR
ncbi:MAG: D-alanine--D-alanine ligase [Rhodospirillales bacterium]|nr:D-alanine--D-alanine ligase [Rhodospirillales bacterium]